MIKIHLSRLLGEHKKRIADLQRDTGLARNTLAGLYRDDVARIDRNTLNLLCGYFNCGVGDLIEWLPDDPVPGKLPDSRWSAAALSRGDPELHTSFNQEATKRWPRVIPMLDDIKKTFLGNADELRANMVAAEYKHLVLGLIFVNYISDTFAARRAELRPRLLDENGEYFHGRASDEDIDAELVDRDYYREANVFWVPGPARWEVLRAAAKQTDIGKRIDEALSLIETQNRKLKNILDKRFTCAQLPDGKLGELVDRVSTIGFGASAREARDVLSQVYDTWAAVGTTPAMKLRPPSFDGALAAGATQILRAK